MLMLMLTEVAVASWRRYLAIAVFSVWTRA
jgi:hypothetical protein